MCLACEEQQAMLWRYHLEMAVERGEIPEGMEPADFEAAGLPVPGRMQAPDAKRSHRPGNPFVCDIPDGE
jgi:hypothetical protein